MRYRIARLLQLVGMIILPVAVAGNLAREEEVTLQVSLLLSAVGIGIFCLGWWLQKGASPN